MKNITTYLLFIILMLYSNILLANPSIKIDSVNIHNLNDKILIEGEFTATGLNTPIPEKDEVNIYIEIKTTPDAKYPIFYKFYNIAQGCLVMNSNCISTVEEKGVNINSFIIFSSLLRDTPVWLKYGGLNEWNKKAPDTVKMKFKGTIPKTYTQHGSRIHAVLTQVIGGPYANWPGISYYHDAINLDLKKYSTSNPTTQNATPNLPNKNRNEISSKINEYGKKIENCMKLVAYGRNAIAELEKKKKDADNKVLYMSAGLSPSGYEAIIEDVKSLKYQNLAGSNSEMVLRDINPLKLSNDLAKRIKLEKLYLEVEENKCNQLRNELNNLKKQLW